MATASGTVRVSTPTDRTIHTERIVDAPRHHVWRAFSEPDLIAQWWGRGHKVDLERWEFERGGHWRIVEHSPEGVDGFEGRFRELSPPDRIVWTFEWDGMPGYVSVETVAFEELDGGRTRIVGDSLFFTKEERDGMLNSGMEQGMTESYSALDRLLASLA